MTGGQMAPTTLEGMKTSTTPYGRRADLNGHPPASPNCFAQLPGTCYVTRQLIHTPATVRKAKAAIRRAFENSMNGRGTSVVEIVSTCNSGWKMSPDMANRRDGRQYVSVLSSGRSQNHRPREMKEEIIIAGFGGQGVLSMGKILAYAGLMDNLEVTWMPSYYL